MPAEDIGQVLLKHPATRRPCDGAKNIFPVDVMGGQRVFGKPGLVRENPPDLVTSVTEGHEGVRYQLSQGWGKTGHCDFCPLGTSGLTGTNSNFINPNTAVNQLGRELFPIKFLFRVGPRESILSAP